MSRHILYCTHDADALVLDLPGSISHAQRSIQSLVSVLGPDDPYPTPEPKGTKRDVLLSSIPVIEREYQKDIQSLLQTTLELVKSAWAEPAWCLPRECSHPGQPPSESTCFAHQNGTDQGDDSPPLVLSSGTNHVCCPSALMQTVVQNPLFYATEIAVSTRGRFIIPAGSTFLHASIQDGAKALEDAIGCLLPARGFDLVLFDPPWSNRSVRRSRAYQSIDDRAADPFEQALSILAQLMTSSGYIAVWITNKTSIRSQVVSACTELGFVLEEEWVWLKVTTKGEPVTPLDGIWRKPYEILLLFGKSSQAPEAVKQRVGIAVPDVHSRKPSLKSMFEQLERLPENYKAIEVFARSLTAGWWAWGDEVLKFQHESNWS